MQYFRTPGVQRMSLGLFAAALAVPSFAQRIDFSRPVFVGDSLTAGSQNGSLHEDFQPNSFANLICRQADKALAQPLIGAPGIPNTMVLVDLGPPPVIGQAPGTSKGRVEPWLQAMNLAVPGHDASEALALRPELPVDTITDLVLGMPGLLQGVSKSQVEWTEALNPTVAIVWVGSNDALGAAINADPSLVTPPNEFARALAQIFDRVSATGAQIVVGNVPDVTVIPYLTSAEELAAQFPFISQATVLALLGIAPGDYVIPSAFSDVAAILSQQQAGPLAPIYVFDASEVMAVQMVVDIYNAVIEMEAREHEAILVDAHALLERIDTGGATIGDVQLTTGFLGGIFSLDGVHPTNTGHAIVANAFIQALNAQGDLGIELVDVETVLAADPLVFHNSGGPPPSPCSPDAASVRPLREMLER